MKRKIPPEAFAFYVSLGVARSYQAVADRFGASKSAVAEIAERERWSERIREIEKKSGEAATKQAVDAIAEMNSRHLKLMKAIQARALETLKSMPIEDASAAVAAMIAACKQERIILGEPSERTAVEVGDVIRREYERWLAPAADDAPAGEAGADAAGGDRLAEGPGAAPAGEDEAESEEEGDGG